MLAAGLASGGFAGGGRRWNRTGPEVSWVAEIEAPRSAGRWALDLGADLPLAGRRSGEWSIQLPAENIPGASPDTIDALYVRSALEQDFRNAVLGELAELVCRFVTSHGTVAELATALRDGALSGALVSGDVREELTRIGQQ